METAQNVSRSNDDGAIHAQHLTCSSEIRRRTEVVNWLDFVMAGRVRPWQSGGQEGTQEALADQQLVDGRHGFRTERLKEVWRIWAADNVYKNCYYFSVHVSEQLETPVNVDIH